MEGFKERLILTFRFIYDANLIYLLFILLTMIISLVLFLGHDGDFKLLEIWYEIIGLVRDNETSYFIQIFIIPVYNFFDWLLTGKYQILPKLITKLVTGRMPLILKTSAALLILLYITSLFFGVYITNQEKKVAEQARIANEIQIKKNVEIAKQKAEENRLKNELLEKENQEKRKKILEEREKARLAKTTYPYQGLTCKNYQAPTGYNLYKDIILILRRNNDNTITEIDLRTRNNVLDGIVYSFETIKDSTITMATTEIRIKLNSNDYNLGIGFGFYDTLTLSRSSLKLNYDDDYLYQCKKVDYEYLYDFVKNHNAKITNKNKL